MCITILFLCIFTSVLHLEHSAFATSLLPLRKVSKLSLTSIHLPQFRGGSADGESTSSKSTVLSESAAPIRTGSPLTQSRLHCADLIPSVCGEFPAESDDEHSALRQLISSRFNTYITDLKQSINSSPGENANAQNVPHPRRLLHYLAPKVPAIKQSPDVNLRVYSSRSGIDSSVAACIIGIMGHACEHYDKAQSQILDNTSMERPIPSYKDIVADRRFEQLVECIISSVNVEKRKREKESSTDDLPAAPEEDSEKCNLSVRDACRAAWGIAVLGGHHLESLGGEKIVDVLQALSIHIRECLAARVESDVGRNNGESRDQQELAQDAALSVWTFACVRACTGLNSDELLESCSSILNRDIQQHSLQPLQGNCTTKHLANETGVANVADFASEENFNGTDSNFLTILSPMEVTDLVWALAIHGSSNSTVELRSSSLPSTAARKLQRAAFSRLFSWLSSDLRQAQYNQLETATVTDLDSEVPPVEETTTLKVVDAAALLASQANGDSSSESDPSQSLELENMTVSMAVRQGVPIQNNVSMVETKDTKNLDQASEVSTQVRDSVIQGDDVGIGKEAMVFHPPDMACIAWAVTELRDSSRMKIVPVVVEIVAMMGEKGTQGLSGADLSNLAWAVSRYEAELSNTRANQPSSLSLSLMSWIAHSAWEQVYTGDIDVFQPPELGRLVWALGCMLSVYSQVPDAARSDKDILELSTLALKKASANINIFDTENLLRICWAFLELHGEDREAYDSSVAFSLGRILSTVERSLNEWERGDCAYPKIANKATTQGTYTALFSSFFGRSKGNQPLLEQAFESRDDDDDNSISSRSRLPLLRDLPVDPSTLCKAACAFQRLLIKHPEIKGGLKLTDVAVRLLSSKSARLMRECSIHDIVRILEAAVHSDAEGYGRQLSTGRFVYRIVQVLNEALDDDSGNDSVSRNIKLEAASPSEIATLFWALGCLGVRHTREDDVPESAYKRLRLVSKRILLSVQQVQSMSTNDSLKLLKGLILMKLSSSDPTLLLDVLDSVNGKVSTPSSTTMLCELAEVISIQLADLNSGLGAKHEGVTDSLSRSSDDDDSGEGVETAVVPPEIEIREVCADILSSVSQEAIHKVNELSPLEMRRLLSVFSLLPFQADEFVNVLEDKVTRATEEIDLPRISTESILRDARDKCGILRQKMSDDSSISRLEALKARLLSLFQPLEDSEPTPETNLPTDLADMIENAINASLEAFSNLENVQKKYGLDIDVYNQRTNEGSQFELGRCKELIANYRRVEFGTGFRRSRYDEERRQYILKQVLSRLR
eukprot:Nitzschia sp. Nitz4//scaffold13_size275219//181877//185890//NITZ4_000891-RA/size275219-augustus-gene-0.269-mRNA-1//-1//CDS//3329536065//5823//frame0